MAAAVARAREVECRNTGGEREACHAELFEGDQMISYGAYLIDKPRDSSRAKRKRSMSESAGCLVAGTSGLRIG